MVTSPPPGATSFDLSDALQKLKNLAESNSVKLIATTLGNDAALHIVGGAVRDTIEGKDGVDLDLATILTPAEVTARLTNAKIHWVPTGIDHGTVLAVLDDNEIEITTFRLPGGLREKPGSVKYSQSISEDLAGRDFTINAIAYDINSGKLIDPTWGLPDLSEKVVRTVGNSTDRFREDPLRLMRMVRFGTADGRSIDPVTFAAAKELSNSITSISVERVRDELIKILCKPKAGNGLRSLRELGILDLILPEVVPSYDFEQNEFHRFDVFEHTLEVIDNSEPDPLLRLTALFHDLGKPHTFSVGDDGRRHFYKHEFKSEHLTKDALKRLRCSNQMTKDVALLVRYHMRPLECGPAAVRRLIRDLGPLLDPWISFKRADSLGAKVTPKDIEAAISKFSKMLEAERSKGSDFLRLAVSGEDLKALGVTEGPVLGNILSALKEMVISDPSLNAKDKLLKLVKEKLI